MVGRADFDSDSYNVIMSRNAMDGKPLQIVDIDINQKADVTSVIVAYDGNTYRRPLSWKRVPEGTYNQDVTLFDLPYISLGKNIYPLDSFVLRIPEADYWYMILGDDIDYSMFDKNKKL